MNEKYDGQEAEQYKADDRECLGQLLANSRINDRLDNKVMHTDGGHLNPEWIKWLMGWPIGATELNV